MSVKSAREWKEFYARERAELGERGMSALLDRARDLDVPAPGKGALLFPHTRLEASGELVASVARGDDGWRDRVSLVLSERLRGEFVDWFRPRPGSRGRW